MEKSFKLRLDIEKEIAKQGLNFSTLSEKSGINRGVFSAILNSRPPKPISFHQLDTITKALDMPPGWLFDEYVGECFYEGKPNRRRIEPFLLACSELGRTDLVRDVLKRMLEDLKYVPFVFEKGEELFMSEKLAQSVPFYESVVEHEKHQRSVRLSVSQYRLFLARLGEDGEENLKAAVQFEPFRSLLPNRIKLDALLRISNLYYELGKYIEMEETADELFVVSSRLYEQVRSGDQEACENEPRPLKIHPLVFYYGSALLHKQLSLIQQGRYEEAKPYSERYGNLDEFEVMDEVGRKEVENFKVFALGNTLDLELKLGNFSILPLYSEYMDRYPNEKALCLLNMVEAANQYKTDIDRILEERYVPFNTYMAQRTNNYYPEQIVRSTFANLHYHLAVYYNRRGRRSESAAHVRSCWQLSQEMNNQQHFRQLASLLSLTPMFVRDDVEDAGDAD